MTYLGRHKWTFLGTHKWSFLGANMTFLWGRWPLWKDKRIPRAKRGENLHWIVQKSSQRRFGNKFCEGMPRAGSSDWSLPSMHAGGKWWLIDCYTPRAKRGKKNVCWNVLICFSETIAKHVLWGDGQQSRTPLINPCPLCMLEGISWLSPGNPRKATNDIPRAKRGKKYLFESYWNVSQRRLRKKFCEEMANRADPPWLIPALPTRWKENHDWLSSSAAKSWKSRKEEKHIPCAKRGKNTCLNRTEMLLRDEWETCFVRRWPTEQPPPD